MQQIDPGFYYMIESGFTPPGFSQPPVLSAAPDPSGQPSYVHVEESPTRVGQLWYDLWAFSPGTIGFEIRNMSDATTGLLNDPTTLGEQLRLGTPVLSFILIDSNASGLYAGTEFLRVSGSRLSYDIATGSGPNYALLTPMPAKGFDFTQLWRLRKSAVPVP